MIDLDYLDKYIEELEETISSCEEENIDETIREDLFHRYLALRKLRNVIYSATTSVQYKNALLEYSAYMQWLEYHTCQM